MKRSVYKSLLQWKCEPSKKPLLLQGARQVGKTYVVNQFGRNEYKHYIYLNFEQDLELHPFFSGSLIPHKIIDKISVYLGKKIVAKDTLIFFDEVQILPDVLTSLKYFQEQAPEFDIIAAGSLLGVSVASHRSFPVGKVNFMSMFPLSFVEYLEAMGEGVLVGLIQSITKVEPLDAPIHDKIMSHLRKYLYIGGMPEVVQDYIKKNDIARVRKLQKEILAAYRRDFSKYNNKVQAVKTAEVWGSLPSQLARENSKFKYSGVRKKARESTFELTIDWLKNAGLINVVHHITKPHLPLGGYAELAKFKLCMVDTGLLGAMLEVPSKIIVNPTHLFAEYNGAFIENFVAQELRAYGREKLYYWTSKSDAEVDYILSIDNEIFPLEVKSGQSRNLKSIRSYEKKYQPSLIYRSSPRNFVRSGNFINVPLYAIWLFGGRVE